MSTKKLAKELGLLRQRSQTSAGSKKSVVSNQLFSYLIVIDFESTCWREKNSYSQEIIEFPAVLLNTATGEIESEFHTYVQPQEHPILSKFCTELTGITQTQVEAGIPLQICLSQFSRWLKHLQLEVGLVFPSSQQSCSDPCPSQKLCSFLTWSDWDLGVCLRYECKRKQLHKPNVLNSWIDLRSTYRLFYNRKPKGLNGALQDLGIQFSGREHSGLDDSRNTAKLASRMMRDGCVMKITRSLETTPATVKPMFGNTTTNKREKSLTTDKASPSRRPFTSHQINSCSENPTNINAKENTVSAQAPVHICQSLISPRTLLGGTTTPLWGHGSGKSIRKESVASLSSSSVTLKCISPNSSGRNSLVLCPTVVNLPQPNQLPETVATVGLEDGEEGGDLLVESERCGSYDDVVLEADDVINDTEYVSAFDSGCYVWEEPECSYLARDQFTVRDDVGPETKTTDPPTTSASTKMTRSHFIVLDQSAVRRQHSAVSEPDTHFTTPKSFPQDSKINQRPNIQQLCKTSHEVHRSFVPDDTSTPKAFFAKPKPVISRQKLKPATKSSFTIYTDLTRQAATPSHPSSSVSLYTPQKVLATLSTNTRSPSTGSLCFPLKSQGGGKVTSPLCACGRRAKRQLVSNGGPNHGRGFYCCPVRRSGSGGRMQKGCEFFKWEASLARSSTEAGRPVRSSVSLCQVKTRQ